MRNKPDAERHFLSHVESCVYTGHEREARDLKGGEGGHVIQSTRHDSTTIWQEGYNKSQVGTR